MPILRKIQVLFKQSSEPDYNKEVSDPLLQSTIRLLLQNAIDCRCGGMNVPVAAVGNEYRCLRCDKLLKNKHYNLGRRDDNYTLACPKPPDSILNMDYYAGAIEFLKKRK